MKKSTIQRFVDLLLTLEPNFPMSSREIQRRLSAHGLDGLFDNAGAHSSALIETVKLLIYLEKGDAGGEPG